MRYISPLIFCLCLLLAGCGGKQRAANEAMATAKRSKVINAHEAARIDFKTLKARLGTSYDNGSSKRSFTVQLRMEKGKQIWMSAGLFGITAAKVYITPDRVQFYEKLNKRSFDGDFSLISEFLGEEITFDQLEDLLLGQAVESLQGKEFMIADNQYQFKTEDVVTKIFKLRPSDFKVAEQTVTQPKEGDFLTVRYPEYQIVQDRILPSEVMISAIKGKRNNKVEMEFKGVSFDEELSFPFEMPSGYRQFEL
ncbi:DUF4292 domain-containing protein [Nonlabens xiamenensis]|uniref:DUF4292 domain-containing protein n=1 Tax=Nonlabens xiamenensis TaxID=2341043 RepID=UPI000F6132D6|nr:DUF4292 domain-containing protein [Nonlabens xiamenensis]